MSSLKEYYMQFMTKPTQNFWLQLLRYLLSGGLAFVVDKLLFLLTRYYFDLDKYISTTIGFSVGLVITYLLSIKWIFNEHRISDRRAEVAIFALIGLVGMGLMNLFMWMFTSVFHFQNDFFSNLCSSVLVTLWNFLAKKYILFSHSKLDKH